MQVLLVKYGPKNRQKWKFPKANIPTRSSPQLSKQIITGQQQKKSFIIRFTIIVYPLNTQCHSQQPTFVIECSIILHAYCNIWFLVVHLSRWLCLDQYFEKGQRETNYTAHQDFFKEKGQCEAVWTIKCCPLSFNTLDASN